MNGEGPATPSRKKCSTVRDVEVLAAGSANFSPESKRLLEMQKDIAKMLECRRMEKSLREKHNMPH